MTKYYVYKLFVDEEVVYIGQTYKLRQRLKNHRDGWNSSIPKGIIDNFSPVEYYEFDSYIDMCLYEIYFINKYKPPYNKYYNNHFEKTKVKLCSISGVKTTIGKTVYLKRTPGKGKLIDMLLDAINNRASYGLPQKAWKKEIFSSGAFQTLPSSPPSKRSQTNLWHHPAIKQLEEDGIIEVSKNYIEFLK